MPKENPSPLNTQLRAELKKVYAKTLAIRVISGLVSFVTVAAWVFFIVLLWTTTTDEPALWQTMLVSRGSLVLAALLFLYFVAIPVVRMPPFRRLALEVEKHKDFKHIIAAGYEFSEHGDAATRYAPELIREVIRQAVRSISGLQVRFLFLNRRQLLFVPVAYMGLVALIAFAVFSPATLFNAGERLASPEAAAAPERKANLFGSPGDITVVAGSDVTVTAFDFGGSEEPVVLSYNLAEGFWKTEPTDETDVPVGNRTTLRQHEYTFRDIRSSITYYFRSGDQASPHYHVNVVHKPIVTDLNIVLTPPAYTREPADTLVDSGGNIQALEGTAVAVEAMVNNVLSGAWVDFGSGEQETVNFSDNMLEFGFTALKDGSYSILLEDERGHRTDEPLVYSIEVYRDNPPLLDVLEPGDNATLPRNLRVDLGFVASDDYGVARASVFYRKNGEERFRRKVIALGADSGKRELAKTFAWDLSDIPLFPGNFVEYFVQIEDNNVVTGPGITKSRIFHIAVPTMAELYDKIKEDESKRSDLFEETVKESQEFKERLEKLSREFKKTEKLDWSQQKEVDKAISAQQSIEEKLEEIKESLEETLESLSDNQMTSQEIGEKLEEINKLIDEINDEALNEYIEQLREAMEKLNPDEIQKALENLNLTAEDLLKSLERTESLLREIQREQEMEEIVRKAKDLMDAQEEVNNQTSDADATDNDQMGDLANKQDELSKKAQELEDAMKEMAEKLDDSQLSEQMDRAAEEFSESQTPKSMKDASRRLQEGKKQQAQQNQQQVMDNLIALFRKVAEAQMQMQMASQRRTGDNLQKLANSTLALSFKQEKLTSELRGQAATEGRSDTGLLAKDQQTYARAVSQIADELYEIAKKSLLVPQSLLEILGEALANMRSSMLFLEQNKAFMSTASASQAVTSLNKATMELLSAAQNCTSTGSGGGNGQMSPLGQMLSQQQQILQQSQKLLEMRAAQEKLLQERQAAIRRLAGQQRSLRELAEQIQKDVKKDERVLGRMDKIMEEMEEVIRDLDSGVLDEQTLRNEERILSRLLDANRSIHSRDYEKKRISTSADDVFSSSDGSKTSKPTSQLLREEIRRAMSLKAPGEFEDLIRLYFRALVEETTSTHGEK